MNRRGRSRFLRFAALLAALGLLLGWMEGVVPDVHDGHRAVPPDGDAWEQLAHGHSSVPAERSGHAPEAPHTCHCVHAHTAALASEAQAPARGAPASSDLSSAARPLASVTPEPHLRPPVA